MKNQPICGDIAKLVENLNRPISTSPASLKDFIYNIVTRTEILALASLQSNTNFKQYRPILGDMPKVIDNLEVPLLTTLATINGTLTKIVTKTEILALVSFLLGSYFI